MYVYRRIIVCICICNVHRVTLIVASNPVNSLRYINAISRRQVVIGIFGNTLSMIVLHKDKCKTATLFLLISLSVADTGFLVTVLLLRVLPSTYAFTDGVYFSYMVRPYYTQFLSNYAPITPSYAPFTPTLRPIG